MQKEDDYKRFYFLGLYFAFFLILIIAHPGYVEKVWDL